MLGEEVEGKWKLKLGNEFHMTNDSYLFKTEPGKGRLPLYEGKMIHQFEVGYAEPRYWVDEKSGRKALLDKSDDERRILPYQSYRFGFRDIARNTDMRTMISTVLQPSTFLGNTINYGIIDNNSDEKPNFNALPLITAVLNSYVLDFFLRLK